MSFCAILAVLTLPAAAQTPDGKAVDKAAGPAQKPAAQPTDEYSSIQREVSGPAGNPECVWLGRRVVSLLWRDDIETAFRHLDLYDRFGCPAGHIQATFRCLILHDSSIDAKSPDSLQRAGRSVLDQSDPAGPAAAGRRRRCSSRERQPLAKPSKKVPRSAQLASISFKSLYVVLNSPCLGATSLNAARKVALPSLRPTSNLGDRFGPVLFRPAWLDFDAHRRCRARACGVRACGALGSPAIPSDGTQHQPSAIERIVFPVCPLRPSRQQRPPDRRANPRRPEGDCPLHQGDPHLFVDRRSGACAADCGRVRPARSRSAPGSARIRRATSARSAPQSI